MIDLPTEHYGLLLKRAREIGIGDPARDAEDIVQEVYLHLLEMPVPPVFNDRGHAANYLRLAVTNRIYSHNRRTKFYASAYASPGGADPGAAGVGLAGVATPDIAPQAIASVALEGVLADAQVELRAAAAVMTALGYEHAELAAQLGVPRNTITSAVHRYRTRKHRARNVRPREEVA